MTDTNEPDPGRIADSVREQNDDDGQSRRGFLSRSVLAGGALLALGGGAGVALGQQEEDDDTTPAFDDVEGTDVDVLNYALSLELFEVAFYNEALDTLAPEDFVGAESLQAYDEEHRQAVYGYVETVADHETQHVEVLMQAVEFLGGEPATPGDYEFEIEDVEGFLSTAQTIENLGVAAYAGAAPFVESPDLLRAALSIHSVEARHAGLFDALAGESPFPNAFDEASSQDEVLDAVDGFAAAEGTEAGEETDTEGGTDAEDGTDTDNGETTETSMDGTDTETPVGDGPDTTPPDGTPGNETVGNGTADNGTTGNGTTGNETVTPNGD